MPSVETPSKSGIIEASTGERHIPSSVRADGTKRKEIKIRPGYKPPEDVEVYKNRTAEGFRTRGTGPIPGAEGLRDEDHATSSASTKNAKRREARKRAKATEDDSNGPVSSGTFNGPVASMSKDDATAQELQDPEAEKEKRARNLKKKLKQAKELKEKKESGAALLPEQFAKVIKINELIRELDALGFDGEGQPKGHDAPDL